ncbi:MAG: hypothetical protein IKL10_07460 [Clostridia bacterium]|nr:hypothetical protein [Clostridia bacterium]
MNKKILSLIFVIIFTVFAFSACKEDEGEPATQQSDSDSVLIKEDFSFIDGQIEKAEEAKAVTTLEDFQTILSAPITKIASYEGSEDITINQSDYIDKTVVINTAGVVSVDSTVNSIVLSEAGNGFTANAKVDNIVIKGSDITADLKSDVGDVYVEGKNAVVNIHGGISKILLRNATATVNNLSSESIDITLVNGTKITLSKNHTYLIEDNIIVKYSPK